MNIELLTVIALIASPVGTAGLLFIGYAKWTGKVEAKAKAGDALRLQMKEEIAGQRQDIKDLDLNVDKIKVHCAENCGKIITRLDSVEHAVGNGLSTRMDNLSQLIATVNEKQWNEIASNGNRITAIEASNK